MELQEAKILLNDCVREELRDHAFGDAEVFWAKDGQEIAGGYFGRDAQVWFEHLVEGDKNVSFDGEDARALRNCGHEGSIERNDETGPDTFTEGVIMPGLTKEAVLQEITKQDLGLN